MMTGNFLFMSTHETENTHAYDETMNIKAHYNDMTLNPFNASCSKLLLFEGSSAILV